MRKPKEISRLETYGQRVNIFGKSGLAMPICYATMVDSENVREGELSALVMEDGTKRFGFMDLETDKFMDMKISAGLRGRGTIERDYKGIPENRLPDKADRPIIVGDSFDVTTQFKEMQGVSEDKLTLRQLASHAESIFAEAQYENTAKRNVRGESYTIEKHNETFDHHKDDTLEFFEKK